MLPRRRTLRTDTAGHHGLHPARRSARCASRSAGRPTPARWRRCKARWGPGRWVGPVAAEAAAAGHQPARPLDTVQAAAVRARSAPLRANRPHDAAAARRLRAGRAARVRPRTGSLTTCPAARHRPHRIAVGAPARGEEAAVDRSEGCARSRAHRSPPSRRPRHAAVGQRHSEAAAELRAGRPRARERATGPERTTRVRVEAWGDGLGAAGLGLPAGPEGEAGEGGGSDQRQQRQGEKEGPQPPVTSFTARSSSLTLNGPSTRYRMRPLLSITKSQGSLWRFHLTTCGRRPLETSLSR